jgi:pyridoxal/pyridoxine/pyridoxamine kinase
MFPPRSETCKTSPPPHTITALGLSINSTVLLGNAGNHVTTSPIRSPFTKAWALMSSAVVSNLKTYFKRAQLKRSHSEPLEKMMLACPVHWVQTVAPNTKGTVH